ncbi:MAG: DUF2332 family protein [Pseudomonadota bacterium]
MTLTEAFHQQAESCARLGSPFMNRLFHCLASRWPNGSRLNAYFETFDGDIGPAGASLPLRLAGGLHALVLSQRAVELAQVYPPAHASEQSFENTVLHAIDNHESFLLNWVQSPPQTNEVRRSAALIAGAAELALRIDRPIWLSELGASGGLNMMWDRYALALPGTTIGPPDPVLTLQPDWTGPIPPAQNPTVAARAGADLNPLDPSQPDDLLRMLSYLWPDQPERLALTRTAAASVQASIVQEDAIDWLEMRLATAPRGHVHLIQHTVAWQYFPQNAQERGRALIEATGAAATENRPLAWLAMESDGDADGSRGAAVTLRIWPGDIHIFLGRADFHGRWIKWSKGL